MKRPPSARYYYTTTAIRACAPRMFRPLSPNTLHARSPPSHPTAPPLISQHAPDTLKCIRHLPVCTVNIINKIYSLAKWAMWRSPWSCHPAPLTTLPLISQHASGTHHMPSWRGGGSETAPLGKQPKSSCQCATVPKINTRIFNRGAHLVFASNKTWKKRKTAMISIKSQWRMSRAAIVLCTQVATEKRNFHNKYVYDETSVTSPLPMCWLVVYFYYTEWRRLCRSGHAPHVDTKNHSKLLKKRNVYTFTCNHTWIMNIFRNSL